MKKPRKRFMSKRAIKPVTTPRIDFINNFKDYKCLIMIALGFSYRFIAAETGFTYGQIWYRGYLIGIRVGFYRDGSLPLAVTSLEDLLSKAESYVSQNLRK